MTESWSARSRRPTSRARWGCRTGSASDEKSVPGGLDELWCQLGLHAARRRHVNQSLQQVARMVAAQRTAAVESRDHLEGAGLWRDGQALTLALEDPAPHLPGRVGHEDLVGKPAKVRLVEQLRGAQVRGQRELRLERYLHLTARRRQVHEVGVLLKRHEQPVEDLLGGDALPAEVVDQQHSTVGLDLERCAVGPAALLPGRLEHLELKLTAHLDQRPRHAPPAPVGGLVRLEAVHRSVEYRHDLAAPDVEGHRDHDRAAKQAWNAPRQRGLAVARRAVDEDRGPRVDGRPDRFGHAWRELDAAKRQVDLDQVEGAGLGSLRKHRAVLLHGDRGRTRVARARVADLLAARAPLLRDGVSHPLGERAAEPRTLLGSQAERVQEVQTGERLQAGFNRGEWKRELLRHLVPGDASRGRRQAQDHALDQRPVDLRRRGRLDLMAGGRDVRRLRLRLVHVLEDCAEQLLAKPRAVGVVGRLTFAPAADPVRHLLEHDGVADQELYRIGLFGGNAHSNPHQVALALQRRPAALPRDVVASRPRLPDSAVARERDVLAVLVAAADELRHVLVDVLRHQRRKRQRAVVDGGPVLDLEDRVRSRRQRPDHARVPGTEWRPLDELDVPAAPPALALAAGQVLVRARPSALLLAVAVCAHAGGLVAVVVRWSRRSPLLLLFDGNLVRDRLDRRLRGARLGHVVERAGERLAALEALAPVLRGRLPDDLHDR